MSLRPRLASVLPFVAALALTSSVARAQPDDSARAAARELGYDGVREFGLGHYDKASDELERAYDVLRVPTIGLWSARALEKRTRLVQAAERYREVQRLDLPDLEREVHEKAKADAETELGALVPRIPRLTIDVTPAHAAKVSLDGKELASALLGTSLPVDPGTHVVVVEEGGARVERRAELAEGEARSMLVTLDEAPPPKPAPPPLAPRRTPTPPAPPPPRASGSPGGLVAAGWIGVGLGGVGVVAGSVLGGVAASEHADLQRDVASHCVANVCPPSATRQDAIDALGAHRAESTGLFIGGGVALAVGVTILLVAPHVASAPPRASGARAGFDGRRLSLSF